MSWLLILVCAWAVVGATVALLVGRGIRLADQREAGHGQIAVPDFVPETWTSPAAGRH
jgi:hypothetical protein